VTFAILRRTVRPRGLALAAALLVPVVAASCAVVPTGSSSGHVDASGAPTGTSSPVTSSPTARPSQETAPPPNPTSPTSGPTATLPGQGPPTATLAAEGGDPVVGQLGTFTWGDGGSDSPWLPGAPVAVGSREPLTVTLADGPPVSGWTARRVRAGATSPAGAVAVGSGSGPISFDAPATGSWTVEVSVTFADGLGSAAYFWRLDIG
jgi:hypothetical protein